MLGALGSLSLGRKGPACHHEVNEVAEAAVLFAKLPDHLFHLAAVGGLDPLDRLLACRRRLRERGQRFEHRQREADARGCPDTAAVEGQGGFSGDAHKK